MELLRATATCSFAKRKMSIQRCGMSCLRISTTLMLAPDKRCERLLGILCIHCSITRRTIRRLDIRINLVIRPLRVGRGDPCELAQSFRTQGHIQRIVAAYQAFDVKEGFARVVGNDEIREKSSSLSNPLYVRADNGNGNGNGAIETVSLKQAIANWQESSRVLRISMDELLSSL